VRVGILYGNNPPRIEWGFWHQLRSGLPYNERPVGQRQNRLVNWESEASSGHLYAGSTQQLFTVTSYIKAYCLSEKVRAATNSYFKTAYLNFFILCMLWKALYKYHVPSFY
jgi:hypothetical protein